MRLQKNLSQAEPRKPVVIDPALRLSGLEPFELKGDITSLTMVGERTNVTGSPRFRKLIEQEDYDSALESCQATGGKRGKYYWMLTLMQPC